MNGLSKVTLAIALLTLVTVILSYFGIVSAIRNQEGAQTAPGAVPMITIEGVGDNVTRITGGTPACRGGANKIRVEASISSGGAGNTIKGRAKCSLSSWDAEATATDPGTGASDYVRTDANPGQGQGYCEKTYTDVVAPDSSWLVTCTF